MAYIRKRPTGYLVCWREYTGAPEKSKAFPKGQKAAADRFKADLEHRLWAAGIAERLRAAVLLAAGTGLRQGELFGLTVDRVDFMRRELRVDRQLWSPKTGPSVFAPPKSKKQLPLSRPEPARRRRPRRPRRRLRSRAAWCPLPP
jgi:integrase